MINWIAGNPLGKKFRALVCHDGIFNTINMYATEELWFINHDVSSFVNQNPKVKRKANTHTIQFKGQIFDHRHNFERWNPIGQVKNWSTPMFIIHSSKDYRIPISEALAAFNILQIKKIKSKFLTFPDENHWVLKPENSLVWHREVFEWLAEFTGVSVDLGFEDVDSDGTAVETPKLLSPGIPEQDVLRSD